MTATQTRENNEHGAAEENTRRKRRQTYILFFAAALLSGGIVLAQFTEREMKQSPIPRDVLVRAVLPPEGVTLPVQWGDLGKKLLESGVIDEEKFLKLYAQQNSPALGQESTALLYGEENGALVMTPENSRFLLNLLWAFGLANKNEILENGPMQNPRYGGNAGRFASTGGWTLARGDAMEHYSTHHFVTLTEAQQALVERVSKNIYRPCCGNSTYFPDCNHGMAMLGLLELMASQDIPEEKMYEIALQVNAYWFPDTYLTIAEYFKNRGVDWRQINPKEILGSVYSSAQGYQQILAEVDTLNPRSGGSCGV
ncbi:MAG: hypothetical protein HYU35_01955 [Parcubacteria group bacterium]|nr:hypothetical protein [Parcubacteria group bacterium]